MNELFEQFGINWKLFLSQAVNFFILLFVLRAFVYKPLLKAVKERNKKIQTGLEKAEQADVRLKEVDDIAKDRLKEADNQSIEIIKTTEEKAKILGQELQKKTEEKQAELQKQAGEQIKRQLEENKKIVLGKAGELVKQVLIKTVELNPEAIDEELIKKAVEGIKNETR